MVTACAKAPGQDLARSAGGGAEWVRVRVGPGEREQMRARRGSGRQASRSGECLE